MDFFYAFRYSKIVSCYNKSAKKSTLFIAFLSFLPFFASDKQVEFVAKKEGETEGIQRVNGIKQQFH